MSLSEHQTVSLAAETVVVAAGRPPRERDQPVNPPIVLSSTYFGTGPLADGDRGYGRYSNPTWDPFEEALGQLEGSELPGLLYASGLAAVSSALSLIPAGGVLVMPAHSYSGSLVMAAELAQKGFIELRTVDIADTDAVREALSPRGPAARSAAMLWLESPTNPMLGIARAKAQMKGFGSIICIQVAPAGGLSGADAADALVRALDLWLPATSLGGVESLIERRRRHTAEPASVPENLVRLSVGIENVEDLWADLKQALDALGG
jgi:cystathionine beta-lyase/cystathionine gamma-synthase